MNETNNSALIDEYTETDLKKLRELSFTPNDYNLNEIENFIYLNNGCRITIKHRYSDKYNESQYINYLKDIVEILKKHKKKYNIKILINNRELLKQANILNTPNINFTICTDGYDYSYKQYLKEEELLNKLVEHIKNSNLSPYEKYIAVYNIVKNFKPYKENALFPDRARYLRYILNNNYIVCFGYATLLKTLLDKVGIPCIFVKLFDENFKEKRSGHARNVIKIDDDKYNIHGIYIADATNDNDFTLDLYAHASLTYDKMKTGISLTHYLPTDYDLLLDFHSLDEFDKNLKCLLEKYTRRPSANSTNRDLQYAYTKIYDKIMDTLSQLDFNKYQELYKKYGIRLYNFRRDFEEFEKVYSEFLKAYAEYIMPLSNKRINLTTLVRAVNAVKTKINNYNDAELLDLDCEIVADDETRFPTYEDPSREEFTVFINNYFNNNKTKR